MGNPIKLPKNYQDMSIRELTEIKIAMLERIEEIRTHLNNAQKLPVKPETGFGSASWRDRANKARKSYERDIMRVNAALKDKAPAIEQAQATAIHQHRAIGDAFMRVSRRILTESLYDGIMQEAKEEISNG